MSDDLPTPRATLNARYLDVLVWCKGGCRHRAPADLQKLVDTGYGDVSLTQLRFRCSNCGSRRTDWVVIARSAIGVQPGLRRGIHPFKASGMSTRARTM
jgi:hypothetical protein